jgi:hypothetical protein
LSALPELEENLSGKFRSVVISEKDVDLRASVPNTLCILKIAEGSLAAGGRGGGFGERRVVKVAIFTLAGSECRKLFETEEEKRVSEFEVPYYVSRIPITMHDGSESMGYGVVEPELVQQMVAKAGVSPELK